MDIGFAYLLLGIVLGAALGYAYALLRSAGSVGDTPAATTEDGEDARTDDSPASHHASPPPDEADERAFDARKLYKLAEELEPLFEESARPGDMLADPRFSAAVA